MTYFGKIGAQPSDATDDHPSWDRLKASRDREAPHVGEGACVGERAGQACRSRGTQVRVAALCLALFPLTLMFIASRLQPSASGLGTHQQLGLPPCTTRMMFGIRCPGCGMTTSWAYFVRGQFQSSATVNLGGFLLAIYSLAVAGLALRAASTGQIPPLPTQRMLATTLIAVFAITITDWIWRLTLG